MLYLAKPVEIYQQILDLFSNDSEESFNKVSLEVFKTQAEHNPTYRRFLNLINCEVRGISHYSEIPLLPISLFKNHQVQTYDWKAEKVFLSSGSSNSGLRSQHLVKSLDWYDSITSKIYELERGGINDHEVLALLPSYLENGDSSLVHMVGNFQDLSKTPMPASYLYEHSALADRIDQLLATSHKPILLIGVTYALLDFAAQHTFSNSRLKVLFTGGMKNKRKEMDFSEIWKALRAAFPQSEVFAEYGMTELLSQAYSNSKGVYHMPATMRVLIKELQDPRANQKDKKTGVVGIIDLANYDSLSFIMSEDLGVRNSLREFNILGRLEQSDLRGCNLLYQPDN